MPIGKANLSPSLAFTGTHGRTTPPRPRETPAAAAPAAQASFDIALGSPCASLRAAVLIRLVAAVLSLVGLVAPALASGCTPGGSISLDLIGLGLNAPALFDFVAAGIPDSARQSGLYSSCGQSNMEFPLVYGNSVQGGFVDGVNGGRYFVTPVDDGYNTSFSNYYIKVVQGASVSNDVITLYYVSPFDYANFTGYSPTNTSLTINLSNVPVAVAPTVASPTSASVTATTATLGGNVTGTGTGALTKVGVVYARTSDNPNPQLGGTGVTEVDAATAATGTFTVNATGLSAGTGYSYAAFATNSVGTTYSAVQTFTTTLAPTLSLPVASYITTTTANVSGSVTSDGGNGITAIGYAYAKSSDNANPRINGPGVSQAAVSLQPSPNSFPFPYSMNLVNLAPGTTYSWATYVVNSIGTVYSGVTTFTTAYNVPTIGAAISSSSISAGGSATLTLTITNPNPSAMSGIRLVLSPPAGVTAAAAPGGSCNGGTVVGQDWNFSGISLLANSSCTVALALTGTRAGNSVFSLANSIVSDQTSSVASPAISPPASLTVNAIAPTVASPTASVTSPTGVNVNGNVTSDGGATLAKVGVVYAVASVNSNPRLNGTGVREFDSGTSSTGTFMLSFGGLTPATTYSYATFATNSFGTTYSAVQTFTTAYNDPTIGAAISASSISVGGSANLTLTITNPNPSAMSGIRLVYTLIAGLTPQSLTSDTCGGAGFSGQVLTVNTALAANSSCTVIFPVNGTREGYYGWATVDSIASAQTLSLTNPSLSTPAFLRVNATLPLVTSPTATNVSFTTATLGGTVSSDGGGNLSQVGIIFADASVTPNPQMGAPGVYTVALGPNSVTSFTINAQFLSPATTYSYAVFATNSAGTTYSSYASFTTSSYPVPTIGAVISSTSVAYLGTPTLMLTLTNPNSIALSNVALSYTLPTGVTPSTTVSGSCSGASVSGQVLTVTGASILANNSCNVVLTLTGTRAGSYNFNSATSIGSRQSGTQTTPTFSAPASLTVNAVSPTVNSPNTSALTSTSATLGGTVTNDGGATLTKVGMVYSRTSDNANPQLGGAGVTEVDATTATTGPFTVNATGLIPGVAYSYAVFATNTTNFTAHATSTFTAPFTVPTIGAAISASPVSQSGTTILTLTVSNPNGSALTGVGLSYTLPTGLTPSPTVGGTCGGGVISGQGLTVSGASIAAGSSCTIVVTLIGTTPGSYSFTGAASIASSQSGTQSSPAFSPTASLTVTAPLAPTVTSPTSASITTTGATLGGNVTGNGGATLTKVGVVYARTSDNPNPQIGGTGVTEVDLTTAATGVFTVNATGLSAGTGYSYAAFATNGAGTTYTSVGTFTASFTAPTVGAAISASPITLGTTTTLTLTLSNPNRSTLSGVLLSYTLPTGVTPSATVGGTCSTVSVSGQTLTLSGATISANSSCTIVITLAGTTAGSYTFATAALTGSAETGTQSSPAFSPTASLTVNAPLAPTVTSPTSASITTTGATLGGNVTGNGGATLSKVGVVYARTSDNPNPRIGGTGVTEVDLTTAATGVFTVNATGLSAGTGYSYAAFATNGAGTTYTSVGTFTASFTAPRIGAAISASPITLGTTTTLTLTLSNSNGANLTGVGLLLTLPTGVTPSTTVGGTCSTASVSGQTLTVSGATISANNSCTLILTLTGTTAGSYTFAAAALTGSVETGGQASPAFSPSASLTVNAPTATAIVVTSFAAAVNSGATTTYTANVTSGGSAVPAGGTVTFLDNGTAVCSAIAVNASGLATCTVAALATGTHPITASYSGTSAYAASTTASPVTVKAYAAPTLAAGFSPTAITITQSATLTMTLANPAANPGPFTSIAPLISLPTFTGLTLGPSTCTNINLGGTGLNANVSNLAAGQSCTIVVSIPAGQAANTYTFNPAQRMFFVADGTTLGANAVGTAAALVVTPATVARFAVTAPSPQVAGAPFSLTVTAQDSGGNTVTTYNGTVRLTSSDAKATVPSTATLANGTATISTTLRTAGAQTLTTTDTVTTTITGTSNPITVNPGAPAAIAVSTGNGQSTTVGTAFATPLAAVVRDANGNAVANVNVTFAAPGSGASGSFAATATVATNASGLATAPAFTANTTAGTYAVTATVAGVTTPASFSLTNAAGAPAAIAVSTGNGQSTTVGTAFATPLAAIVRDANGNAVPNVNVTFAAPGSGASGSFAAIATVATNASGLATAPAFTANTTAGTYAVTAAVAGVTTRASFSLTNAAGAPAAIAVSTGNGQSATVGTAFATPLAAIVRDANGNPVPNVNVTFAAPGSGASGSFAAIATVATNASGLATAPAFTANTTAGTFAVTASVAGVATPASFSLTNAAGAPSRTTISGGDHQSATPGTAFAVSLSVNVTDSNGNPVANARVTFEAPTSGASGTFSSATSTTELQPIRPRINAAGFLPAGKVLAAATPGATTYVVATNAQGVAAVRFTANGTAGSYGVTATIANGASTRFTLTNTKTANTITFQPVAPVLQGTTSVALVASATSGDTVIFSSLTPAVCTVSGASAVLVRGASGTCTIAANDPGNATFAAAPQVTQSFAINLRPDPSRDAEVTGLIRAQTQAAQQFADVQIQNFNGRLEQMHGDGYAPDSFGLSLTDGLHQDPNDGIGFAEANPAIKRSEAAANTPRSALAKTDRETTDREKAVKDKALADKEKAASLDRAFAFWTAGAIQVGRIHTNNTISSTDLSTTGISVGADYRLNQFISIGLGLGYGATLAEIGDNGTKTTGRNYDAVLYSSIRPTSTSFIDILAGAGLLDFRSDRYITGGLGRATGKRTGYEVFGSVTAGADIKGKQFNLTPYLRVDGKSGTLNAFDENGPALWALHYDKETFSTASVNLGIKAAIKLKNELEFMHPFFRAEFQHDLVNTASAGVTYVDLVGTGTTYQVALPGSNANRVMLGLGAEMTIEDFQLSLEYMNAFSTSSSSDASMLRFKASKRF